MKRMSEARLVIGLVFLCFCMRAPMSIVGPLVPQIKETLHLNSAFSGLITTIPLLIFAVSAPFAGKLLSRLPISRLFPCCAAAILAGIVIRSYCGLFGLIGGTVLLGIGIGMLNVIIPVWIRHAFPQKIGTVMAVYSTTMTALSALAAGICVSLSACLFGWQNAMAVFALLPIIALPVWLWLAPFQGTISAQEKGVSVKAVVRAPSNRCVAIFMGVQSALFFVLIAWLPSILMERGINASTSGMLILVFQLVSLITNFLMPIWFQRCPARRRMLAASCALVYAFGFTVLLIKGSAATLVLSVVLLGLGSGLSLSFALTAIAVKGKDSGEAAAISSFSQCVGYSLAAPAPFILGALFDATGNFKLPIIVLLLLCVPLLFFGTGAVAPSKAK